MRTKAIVIKKQNTNEYDQLVTCYTEEFGKLTAIAKSILKKSSLQAMHLDVLNMVEFDLVAGRALPIIASAHSDNVYSAIKKSIKLTAVASFFADLVDKIIFDNEKDPAMWDLLNHTLQAINDAGENNVMRNAQAKFLNVSGYSPQTSHCALCLTQVTSDSHIDHEWALNFDLGGLICRNCHLQTNRGFLLRSEDLKILKNGQSDSSHIGKSSLDIIFEGITGRKLNSLQFVYQARIKS